MDDKKLLMERLKRLAIVLDELMPGCAELVRDTIALLKGQEETIKNREQEIRDKNERLKERAEQVDSLLKEQEVKPVKSVRAGRWYECPRCGHILNRKHDKNFCGFCGQAVKWE